ncbi:hypothetical protein KM043_002505 [Ampulex compressa]|nr:hypothetical protein KM043_002505 [Ampulex compressa]
MSSLDYLDLCRLCLVKDRVSVPIFEGEGDVRQIFLKIAACLPVKVAREDKLPKKICDDCVYKVELFYQFWNTTANAEKQLLQWLGEVGLEDKQGYVTNVLNPNVMKQEQNSENRLDGTVMQQVSGHQNSMGMGMMDNMGLGIPMIISTANQQQITSVPMDTSGNSVQTVQAVPGPSSQTTHNQMSQNQSSATQQEEEEESSEEDENSDEECMGDEGLPVKEESEEDPNNSRTIEPTTFVNVSLACDEAGPSGLQQQKISDMPEITIPQPADGEPKSGEGAETFGGLSGMLRQILSPSPETGEAGLSASCTLLQTNSIFSNQSSMLSLQTLQPHVLPSICPDQGLLDHVQILTESHPCLTCGLEFRSALKLNYHIRTSHPIRQEFEHSLEGPARYSCPVCSRTFFALSHLRMHEVTHTVSVASCATTPPTTSALGNVEKTFACEHCQASFRYRTLLERHRKMHEAGQDKPYSCARCPMRFETRNLYNHHAKTHKPSPAGGNDRILLDNVVVSSGDSVVGANVGANLPPSSKSLASSYPCDSCSKQFATIESLTSHKAVHRSRPLVCDVCGKGFTHRKYYVVHQRIHTGERPYLCAMCGKSFTQASTLTVHRRYHTGERPYTCTLCGKGFVTRTIMLNHMKKH